MELLKEKWTGKVNEVTIGATEQNGGTRSSSVTVGGETALPYLFAEGEMPHTPVIAMEVLDILPEDWPESLKKSFGDVLSDLLSFALGHGQFIPSSSWTAATSGDLMRYRISLMPFLPATVLRGPLRVRAF